MRHSAASAALALLTVALVSVALALYDASHHAAAGSIEALVTATFWHSPVLLSGAFAPFILLAVALGAGRWLKRREERLGGGPVRPPGWKPDR